MRHRVKTKKFGRNKDQRSALYYALSKALIENDVVKTTTTKAKYIRPVVEKLVTKAKAGDSLATRRYLLSRLRNNTSLVEKLLNDISAKYKDRNGGYLRIRKSYKRAGDNAEVSLISWVEGREIKKDEPKKSEAVLETKKSKTAKTTSKAKKESKKAVSKVKKTPTKKVAKKEEK